MRAQPHSLPLRLEPPDPQREFVAPDGEPLKQGDLRGSRIAAKADAVGRIYYGRRGLVPVNGPGNRQEPALRVGAVPLDHRRKRRLFVFSRPSVRRGSRGRRVSAQVMPAADQPIQGAH